MSSPKNFDDTYLENLWFFPFKTVSFALWVDLLSCVKFSCILQQFIKRAVKALLRYWTRSNADFTPKWFGFCLTVRFQYQEHFDDIFILQWSLNSRLSCQLLDNWTVSENCFSSQLIVPCPCHGQTVPRPHWEDFAWGSQDLRWFPCS